MSPVRLEVIGAVRELDVLGELFGHVPFSIGRAAARCPAGGVVLLHASERAPSPQIEAWWVEKYDAPTHMTRAPIVFGARLLAGRDSDGRGRVVQLESHVWDSMVSRGQADLLPVQFVDRLPIVWTFRRFPGGEGDTPDAKPEPAWWLGHVAQLRGCGQLLAHHDHGDTSVCLVDDAAAADVLDLWADDSSAEALNCFEAGRRNSARYIDAARAALRAVFLAPVPSERDAGVLIAAIERAGFESILDSRTVHLLETYFAAGYGMAFLARAYRCRAEIRGRAHPSRWTIDEAAGLRRRWSATL